MALMDSSKPSLVKMALNFFKIGLTSWGGPAILAQIKRETVDRTKWITEEEFKESLGFCQMLPGPIAVQTSAHLGYRMGGTLGSVAAFISYTIPTVLFMFVLSFLYFRFEGVPSFIKLFGGLGIVVVAIIADAQPPPVVVGIKQDGRVNLPPVLDERRKAPLERRLPFNGGNENHQKHERKDTRSCNAFHGAHCSPPFLFGNSLHGIKQADIFTILI